MSNVIELCPTHFSSGGERFSRGGFAPLRPSWLWAWTLVQHYCRTGRQFLNRSSPGKVRMRCGMTCHPSNKHCNVRALSHKVKCDCGVQRIGTNMNNLTALIKARNHTLFDFLHLSRNRYTFFSQQGLKGRNLTLNLMTTNTCSPGQVV